MLNPTFCKGRIYQLEFVATELLKSKNVFGGNYFNLKILFLHDLLKLFHAENVFNSLNLKLLIRATSAGPKQRRRDAKI